MNYLLAHVRAWYGSTPMCWFWLRVMILIRLDTSINSDCAAIQLQNGYVWLTLIARYLRGCFGSWSILERLVIHLDLCCYSSSAADWIPQQGTPRCLLGCGYAMQRNIWVCFVKGLSCKSGQLLRSWDTLVQRHWLADNSPPSTLSRQPVSSSPQTVKTARPRWTFCVAVQQVSILAPAGAPVIDSDIIARHNLGKQQVQYTYSAWMFDGSLILYDHCTPPWFCFVLSPELCLFLTYIDWNEFFTAFINLDDRPSLTIFFSMFM